MLQIEKIKNIFKIKNKRHHKYNELKG